MCEKDEIIVQPLDSTIINDVIQSLQAWINNQAILASDLYLDYVEETNGIGFCIKTDSGQIYEEDILGNFTADIIFFVYYTTDVQPDGGGLIYKPLNDLSDWFVNNDFTNLQLGTSLSPKKIMTLKGPVDVAGQDENGNTTFYSTYKFTFYEEEQ